MTRGPFEHYCHCCGKWGAFGIGVFLRQDKPGTWLCREHWEESRKPAAAEPGKPACYAFHERPGYTLMEYMREEPVAQATQPEPIEEFDPDLFSGAGLSSPDSVKLSPEPKRTARKRRG